MSARLFASFSRIGIREQAILYRELHSARRAELFPLRDIKTAGSPGFADTQAQLDLFGLSGCQLFSAEARKGYAIVSELVNGQDD
jgi:hypothetical protein